MMNLFEQHNTGPTLPPRAARGGAAGKVLLLDAPRESVESIDSLSTTANMKAATKVTATFVTKTRASLVYGVHVMMHQPMAFPSPCGLSCSMVRHHVWVILFHGAV